MTRITRTITTLAAALGLLFVFAPSPFAAAGDM